MDFESAHKLSIELHNKYLKNGLDFYIQDQICWFDSVDPFPVTNGAIDNFTSEYWNPSKREIWQRKFDEFAVVFVARDCNAFAIYDADSKSLKLKGQNIPLKDF